MWHKAKRLPLGLGATILLVGSMSCYHSIIDTGLEPSGVEYYEEWEPSWFVGLIPARVEATHICDGPWARVETQQSFLNGFVTFFTLGIYAPHEVRVVCAAEPSLAAADDVDRR